ncbi:S8 family serine peptidase [Fictibacillus nanhaiensis]|uniref:S8 family serine peptidase n=1 Tax=Fictibacillus nanhaiensis TaxID=742169 RepID=UPI001C95F379|nr:S8 family serine peptidase [Fictibacillus nanhaiensis]MBY6037170.1 S8 family serine peptidase [Fictibacillus nanhaiensis]
MNTRMKLISAFVGAGFLLSTTFVYAEAPQGSHTLKKGAGYVSNHVVHIPKQTQKKANHLFKPNLASKHRLISSEDVRLGYKKGEVIVKFKPNQSIKSLGLLVKEKGLKVNKVLDKNLRLQLVKFDDKKLSMKEMLRQLHANPAIEYAEPNYIYQPTGVSDPYYSNLWGLKNTGQSINGVTGKAGIDINVETAWTKTKGTTSTVVAVIDTGIDISHPDLKDNVWINPGEIPNDGIDNDNNGYVDDINGWNFFDNNNRVYYYPDEDLHGTHVAGTIAGKANTIGVIGVAPNIKVMSLKFIGPDGGYLADAISAIQYAKNNGIKITNNSWGGGSYSQALYDAIHSSQSLFVAASGNDGVNADSQPMYPAAYDAANILSVAAIDNTGNLAYFSNYGTTSVDVAAPGVSIYSTTPENSYGYLDGTSMATPHATGAAALIASASPSFTTAQLKDKIMKTVTKLSSLTGKVGTGGLINAGNAINGDTDGDIPGVPLKTTSISSKLDASSDKNDVYSLTLLKGEKFTVTMSGDSGTDFDVYLYNSSAKTVHSSAGIVAYSEKLNTSSETFTYTAPSTGIYYLDFYAYKGKGKYNASIKNGVTAGTYQDTSGNISFTNNWKLISNSSASGGSYKTVNYSEASAEFVFNGTGITYYALKSSTQGIAKVTLDGTAYNVDLWSSNTQYKTSVFSKTGLKAGRHVLKIEWTGKTHSGAKKTATNINVDSLLVK